MKKVIALAISGALVAPTAFAAEDNFGMRYTSASEGFYGSIRTRLNTGSNTANPNTETPILRDSSSRLGVQGTHDLGGGLSGAYRAEWGIGGAEGDPLEQRMRWVGLQGNFGSVHVGNVQDDTTYLYARGNSDVAQVNSGNFNLGMDADNSIQYNTPDLNGFKAGVQLQVNQGDPSGEAVDAVVGVVDDSNTADENEFVRAVPAQDAYNTKNTIDAYALGASYSVAGFKASATYALQIDGFAPMWQGLGTGAQTFAGDDAPSWAIGLSYSQDNWYVGSWYGEQEQRFAYTQYDNDVTATPENAPGVQVKNELETFSIGGTVDVDKVGVYGVYEAQDNVDLGTPAANGAPTFGSNALATFGVVYHLGSRSRVWVEYASQDNDANTNADDYITIGLRHDF